MVQGKPGDCSAKSSEIQDPSILTSMRNVSWLKVAASAPAIICIPGSGKEEWIEKVQKGALHVILICISH